MKQAYLVTYDICDPKRLRLVFQTMKGYGDHLQLSVFRCELNERERVELMAILRDLLNQAEDQVLFVDLGPAEGRGKSCIEAIGRGYTPPEKLAVIV